MDARKREAVTKEEAPAASLSGAGVQTEENRKTLITEEKSNTSNTEEKSDDTAGIGTPNTEDKSNDTAGIGTSNTEDKTYHPESSTRNANSRMVFRNPTLACQFLKEYVNLPIFQDLKPEDIQDVTDKYKAFLGVEFETDTVKYIRLPSNGRETELFVVSLNFRYPPIIPVVYYEGSKRWTAETQLRFRIQAEGDLLKYVPDFTYHLISLNDYGKEEFEEKNDEMSLVMMMNKVQNEEGYREFLQAENRYAERIYDNAPEDIKRIIRDVAWSLLMSMKVPEAEAQKMMEEMGVKGMGYLFENFSGIDIAGDRQRLAEARKELADARKEVEKAQREAAEAQREAAQANKEAAQTFARYYLSQGTERREIEILLQKIFQKGENEAVSIMDQLIS